MMKQRLHIVVMALALGALLAQAGFSQTWVETRLTPDGASARTPKTYDEAVMWADSRNYQTGFDEIRKWTADAGETVVRQIPYDWGTTFDAMYENNLILRRRVTSTNHDLYLWNASTGIEVPISTASGKQQNADIYQSTVVYEDHSGTYPQVMLWDAQNGSRPISPTNSSQYNPRISSGGVVWEDYRNGRADIYRWTPTDGERLLSTYIMGMMSPAIYQDRVVMWALDDPYSNLDEPGLWEWTPQGGLQKLAVQQYPYTYGEVSYNQLWGDMVVWGGPTNVVSWDPIHGFTRVNQSNLGDARAPSLYGGNTVAWVANGNVYLSTLIPEPSALLVMMSGCTGLLGMARRRRTNA